MTEPRTIRPYPQDEHDHPDNFNDLGFQADLNMLSRSVLDRRRVLALGLLGGVALLTGCAAGAQGGTGGNTGNTGGTTGGTGACAATPSETAGPFPADGSQSTGLNVRNRTGVVRPDIRTSLGTGNTAGGIPLTLNMKLVDVNASCAALGGYAVYAWHCTADGKYSLYEIVAEDYLRGIQQSGADGVVTFQTIFPGCYAGRWPHIHFEVFRSLTAATSAERSLLTSQLAFPEATCREAYASSGYGNSLSNLGRLSLSTDGIFRDGSSTQLATMSGDARNGYTADIVVGLNV